MASIKKILPPQPHFLSGYTGFVAGLKFHCGHTFGGLTHALFLDPKIKRSDIPILVDLTKLQSAQRPQEEYEILENRCKFRECKYGHDMVPGYDGHIPQSKYEMGKSFSEQAIQSIIVFEEAKRKCLCPECKTLQRENTNEYQEITDANSYQHPFEKTPGGIELFKEMCKKDRSSLPGARHNFLDSADPLKLFINGYAGHVPIFSYHHGSSYSITTKEAMQIFIERYKKLKSNSMVSVAMPLRAAQTNPITHKLPYEAGVIKGYRGHIPGFKFNVGQTFSDGSKNVRNVLRGR